MQTRLVPGCRGVVELAKVLFAVWMLGSSYTSQYRFCGSIVCNRTRFPTFPSWAMRTRIRSAKGCRTTSVRTSLMTFELCFWVSMLGLPGERDQSRVATPPSRLSATHHHPVPSHTMTITLGSRGKGRDLEMGWWQYLPLGERSQRCVNAVRGRAPVAEGNADRPCGQDYRQYLRHILRSHASLDGSSPL
jgi:hypothetical protein